MSTAAPGQLIDGFGRRITNLRISITDRCNFRCTYCMPPEGLVWLDRAELLTYEEHVRIVRLAVQHLGVTSVRITGGEPLVRHQVPQLVQQLASLGIDLAMTTNGTGLVEHAAALAAAGLQRINVSLDSVDPETFTAITGRNDLDQVIAGLAGAATAGLHPVKINAVIIRGVNDDGLVDLARFARDHGYALRCIEFMPLDAHGAWTEAQVVPGEEIVQRVGAVFPFLPASPVVGADPATLHHYADGKGSLGVIPSVTEPFCASCDRMRITSDGGVRACLFSLEELDLRSILRSGARESDIDQGILSALRLAAAGKWEGHHVGRVDFIRPLRGMSQIGG